MAQHTGPHYFLCPPCQDLRLFQHLRWQGPDDELWGHLLDPDDASSPVHHTQVRPGRVLTTGVRDVVELHA